VGRNRVQIVILCEDRQQEVFARYFLKKYGFSGQPRAQICPPGSQSGEQYVCDQYSKEVRAYRQKKNQVKIGLVVFIDADTNTLQSRLQKLEVNLSDDGQKNRQLDEAIAIFIPKRNIETWIRYLRSEEVDEVASYSKAQHNESSCKDEVEQLAENCKHQKILPTTAPSSLRAACQELQRLLPLL